MPSCSFTCILSSPAPSPPLPPLHSPSAPRRMCVFYSFHTLSRTACSFFTTTASLNLTSPRPPTLHAPHPFPPHLSARRQTTLDVGIQFVLYVSFLLRFRFISCWLLLINSVDMCWGGERESEIKTPHIRQWVTPAIIYHLDSSAEAPRSLPWQLVPWWLIPRQCGIAAGNRAHELTVPATSF